VRGVFYSATIEKLNSSGGGKRYAQVEYAAVALAGAQA
jgi:hypothetical protein